MTKADLARLLTPFTDEVPVYIKAANGELVTFSGRYRIDENGNGSLVLTPDAPYPKVRPLHP